MIFFLRNTILCASVLGNTEKAACNQHRQGMPATPLDDASVARLKRAWNLWVSGARVTPAALGFLGLNSAAAARFVDRQNVKVIVATG